jgi:putative flippase GtrA
MKGILHRTFPRFLLAGSINTLAGYGAIITLEIGLGVSAIVANGCGYLFGVLISYESHKRFTFRSQAVKSHRFPLFLGAVVACYLINVGVLLLTVSYFRDVPAAMAQALALLSYILTFYMFSRYFVFKPYDLAGR